MAKKFDVSKHCLVPKHSILGEKEKKDLFEKYNLVGNELPRISIKDPAIAGLKLKEGSIIKIIRPSPTAGRAIFYRRVTRA